MEIAFEVLLNQGVVRLYVVEGQALFGKALCQIFSFDPNFQVVGDSNALTVEKIELAKPDVVILDLDGLAGDVTSIVMRCREAAPQAKICVLSMRIEPELVNRCIVASAEGFIVKDIMPNELLNAVKMVVAGTTYIDPRAAGSLLRMRSCGRGRPDIGELSKRELDIVRLVAEGLSNKEISVRLGVSEKTVKNHMGRIFSKLNINARSQAAVYAIKNGLV